MNESIRLMMVRDLAYVYRDLREMEKRLENAITNAEFRQAQARFEQVEAEWLSHVAKHTQKRS